MTYSHYFSSGCHPDLSSVSSLVVQCGVEAGPAPGASGPGLPPALRCVPPGDRGEGVGEPGVLRGGVLCEEACGGVCGGGCVGVCLLQCVRCDRGEGGGDGAGGAEAAEVEVIIFIFYIGHQCLGKCFITCISHEASYMRRCFIL